MILQNDRLIRALLQKPVDATPVWIMRQAGRYLPEYRKLREQARDFMTLCKTPELACEVTMQPLRRFALDAAIIFSDILTIPDALGLGLSFAQNQGPVFAKPLRNEQDIKALHLLNLEENLDYVFKAIQLVKKELAQKLPLIGFSGSPWTLAAYMVEGGSSKDFSSIKRLMFDEPHLLECLLEKLASAVSIYLNAQIKAGVDAVMIFDTWGGVLTQRDYQQFSLKYMTNIIKSLDRHYQNREIPIILFTKQSAQWLEMIAKSGCNAISIDWTITLDEARKRVGHQTALQGNMDPAVLYASPLRIRQEVESILQSFGAHPGHVFNLGHGIYPDVPPEHVDVLVNAVHELSQRD